MRERSKEEKKQEKMKKKWEIVLWIHEWRGIMVIVWVYKNKKVKYIWWMNEDGIREESESELNNEWK
jgi:hypothetical protein